MPGPAEPAVAENLLILQADFLARSLNGRQEHAGTGAEPRHDQDR